jgi:hypothetical protein
MWTAEDFFLLKVQPEQLNRPRRWFFWKKFGHLIQWLNNFKEFSATTTEEQNISSHRHRSWEKLKDDAKEKNIGKKNRKRCM